MSSEIFEPDAIDFFDWEVLDKIREGRASKEIKLLRKAAKGDKSARKSLIKHRREDEIIKRKSQQTGYYWF